MQGRWAISKLGLEPVDAKLSSHTTDHTTPELLSHSSSRLAASASNTWWNFLLAQLPRMVANGIKKYCCDDVLKGV